LLNLDTKFAKFPIFILQLSPIAQSVTKNIEKGTILYCFCKFYNAIQIIERFKS
jgi:hypothetical protein